MKALSACLLLLPFLTMAQDAAVPGILIAKVNESSKSEILAESADWVAFNGLEVLSVRQMFPNAEDPKGRTDRFGNPFVDLSRTFRLHLSENTDLNEAIRLLMSTGLFEWVEHTTRSETFSTPNDPNLPSQNHLTQIDVFSAWAVTTGDTNTVIGVTDTSFDIFHQDLQGNLKYNYDDPVNGVDDDGDGFVDNYAGWDIADNNNTLFVANNFHGTGVLAVSSATTDNGVGIAGVGYHCKYLPVKIGNSAGSILTADGYEAITYCADRNCKIINCSWGTTTSSQLGQDVVDYATINKDALVVAAAGNLAVEEYRYPASFHRVLSVTGVHNNDVFNNGSNPTFTWADSVDLCAQGFNVYSTATVGGTQGASPVYTTTGGTSYAAPQVSGAAALIRSHFSCLTAIETAALLLDYAVDIEGVGTNSNYAGKIGKRLDIGAVFNMPMNPCEITGLDEQSARNGLLLFPNPSSDEFTVRTNDSGRWTLTVTDMQGRAVMHSSFVGERETVRGLAPGLYAVQAESATKRLTARVIVVAR
jgi:serine protease